MSNVSKSLIENEVGFGSRQDSLRRRIDYLNWQWNDKKKRLASLAKQSHSLREYLALAPEITDALQTLGAELFEQDLRILEDKMSIALQEVLQQPIRFRATAGFKNNVATVEFAIEREGNNEDIRRGQGGSVHNILSVGLRMFALTTLNASEHRRFLMLDEQDCWLQPELVPRLVKIIHQAGKELGYQVMMISHHDLNQFDEYADKIYRFEPQRGGMGGVKTTCVSKRAAAGDLAQNPIANDQ